MNLHRALRRAWLRAALLGPLAAMLTPERLIAQDAAARGPEMPDLSDAGPRGMPCPTGTLRIAAGRTIQDEVDLAPPGAGFCIGAGRHRGQTILPKDGQRFFGEPGAVLDGTVDLTRFDRDGPFWVTSSPAPRLTREGRCRPSAPACDRPEIVLLDGRPLTRVLHRGELGPGRFTIDDTGRIALADDPTGRQVAASAAAFAVVAHGARGVTVADLTIEHYGNPAQRGAVFGNMDRRASGWTVEHNLVRLNSGLGILAGPGARVLGNWVENNGQLGISASQHDEVIEGNVIVGNNTRGFDPEWEAGGFKAAADTGLVVRRNAVCGNHGPGLWCDIDCRLAVFEENLVRANDGAGIFYEISSSAVIRNNSTLYNGTAEHGWFWGANIQVAASNDVVVENNRVAVDGEGTGIALVDQGRRRDRGGYYRTAGDQVIGNDVSFLGRGEGRMGAVSDVEPDSPNAQVIEQGGNLFAGNHYTVGQGVHLRFGWGRASLVDFDAFKALGQDTGSTLVRPPSAQSVGVAAAVCPASPRSSATERP